MEIQMRRAFSLAFCLAMLSFASAHADVVYSTLNYDDSGLVPAFYWNGSYVSGSASPPGVSYVADAFTLPQGDGTITSYQLSNVRTALSLYGGTGQVSAAIMSVDEEGLPDDILASLPVGTLGNYADPSLIDISFVSQSLLLLPGNTYYLAMFPGAADTAAIWHFNYDPTTVYNEEWGWWDVYDGWRTGTVAWHNGSIWQISVPTEPAPDMPPNDALHAFEINATPLPEPASLGLVGLSFTLLVRRRTASRS